MAIKDLNHYNNWLKGCRFCPMCKPAAEVANISMIESHTTRARAMMLWRITNQIADYTLRDVEILYQSTLDSISQSWCVEHYPVSAYVVAARAEVYAKGLAPQPVLNALQAWTPEKIDVKGEVILLASEASNCSDRSVLQLALGVLKKIGIRAEPLTLPSGAVAYSLGAMDRAHTEAEHIRGLIQTSGAHTVIADGPQTLWALTRIYPALDVPLPKSVTMVSLTQLISRAVGEGTLIAASYKGKKAILHDARSACLLADRMAQDQAIQPGFQGPETILGEGEVYDAPRTIIDSLGMERLFTTWSRSLAKSCGADDGLSFTYPDLARALAHSRFREAEELCADMIVCDSLLCAHHLKENHDGSAGDVKWIAELFFD